MKNGYEIQWTSHALNELESTFEYLSEHFSTKEITNLSKDLEAILKRISKNPKLFPLSSNLGMRRVVIKKYNTMYYRERQNKVQILSFFSNRQNPKRSKLL